MKICDTPLQYFLARKGMGYAKKYGHMKVQVLKKKVYGFMRVQLEEKKKERKKCHAQNKKKRRGSI
jgi:hypothetical protein